MRDELCSIPDCKRRRHSRGWCAIHYGRWYRNGDPNIQKQVHVRDKRNTVDWFWAQVEKTSKCWVWNGSRQSTGHGYFYTGAQKIMAYRFAYELIVAPIPDGASMDHLCHNPTCVNPEHLRTATHQQNMWNRKGAHRNSKSGVRGVYWDSRSKRWRGQVIHKGLKIHVGYFATLTEAATATEERRRDLPF